MSEKTTLIEKLPPLAKADSPASAPPSSPTPAPVSTPAPKPTPAPKVAAQPVEKSKPATAAKPEVVVAKPAEKQTEPVTTVAVEGTPPPGITSTPIQHATYYSFLGDAVIIGCIGLFFFGKAFKDKAKVRFLPMATYGGLLIAIGFMFFIFSKLYAGYLRGEGAEPGLGVRGFCWAVFAPVLFYVLSRVIKVPAQDKKLYFTMFGLGSGIFLFIGISQLMGGRLEQLGLSVFPFLFAISLTMLLIMTLGKGASSLRGKMKQGMSLIVYLIIGAWLLYPVLNLVSHLTGSMTIYSLLLNVVDLALLAGVAYGLWGAVSTSSDRISFNASFGKAKRGTPSPMAARESDSPDMVVTREAGADDGKEKPSFKRPKRPTDFSKN